MGFRIGVVAGGVALLGVTATAAPVATKAPSVISLQNPVIQALSKVTSIERQNIKVEKTLIKLFGLQAVMEGITASKDLISANQISINYASDSLVLSKISGNKNGTTFSIMSWLPLTIKDIKVQSNQIKQDSVWIYTGKNIFSFGEINFANNMSYYDTEIQISDNLQGDRVLHNISLTTDKIKGPNLKDGNANIELVINTPSGLSTQLNALTGDMAQDNNKYLKYKYGKGLSVQINKWLVGLDGHDLSITGNVNISQFKGNLQSASLDDVLNSVITNSSLDLNIKVSKQYVDDYSKILGANINQLVAKSNYTKSGDSNSDKQQGVSPKDMETLVNALVDEALDQGYIKEQGDNYISHIVYKDGKLYMNGKLVDMGDSSDSKDSKSK